MPTTEKGAEIKDLVSLAGDSSLSGRGRLLTRVTDLFTASSGSFNEQASLHLEGILESLARTVGSDARRDLGRRLGNLNNALHSVVVKLANDSISIANPLLTRSPVLEDQDLIDIVDCRTQEHLLAISTRTNLHESVADALAEKGNNDVLLSLAQNTGAVLSRPTAAHLVGRSQVFEPLQVPLVGRSDIPTDLVFQIYWWAPQVVRKQILSVAENLGPSELNELLKSAGEPPTNDITRQEGTLSPAQELVRELAKNETLTEDSLVDFLRGGQVPEFAVALAHVSDINLVTARRVLQDKDSESLAMVCKANGFNKQTFTSLESLVYQGATRAPDQIAAQHAVFDKVDPGLAKTALAIWRQGPDSNATVGECPPKGANMQSAEYFNLPGQKLKKLED